MRNKWPGRCYFCDKWVEVGDGHFERYKRSWRVIHAKCVLKQRKEKSEKPIKEVV